MTRPAVPNTEPDERRPVMPNRPADPRPVDAALATLREMLPSMEGHEDNCPCSVGRAHAALGRVRK